MIDLAIQFAEANRQEQEWLREEIKEWKTLVMAILQENGGEIKISKRSLDAVRKDDIMICEENAFDRSYTITLREK